MTDRIALVLALVVVGFFFLDLFVMQWGASMFLVRKFVEFVEYLSFWR